MSRGITDLLRCGDRPMRTIGLVRLASRRPSDLAERFAATLRELTALPR